MRDFADGDPHPAPPTPPDPPDLGYEEELYRRLAEADARWAADLMDRQTRRTWLIPLLAVPTAQVVAATEIPPTFLLLNPSELAAARSLGNAVLESVARIAGDASAQVTPEEALDIIDLVVLHHDLLSQIFAMKPVVELMLGLPGGLSGEGLVRRLAQSITDRPEPPGRLAVLMVPLLTDLVRADKGRAYLPLAHSFFTSIARTFDRRCYELGLKSWADALRHTASVWNADGWRTALLAYSAGTFPYVFAETFARLVATPAESRPGGGGERPRRRGRDDRELSKLRDEVVAARSQAEAANTATAAANLRQAELVHARDRAQARVEELTARCQALEAELREAVGELRAHRATLRRLSEPDAVETAKPDAVPPPALPRDLLRGRTVFFFTGQERAVAARAQADALRELGAEDIRLYEVHQGRPGPDLFPTGSVVIVDTRFVGHQHTDDIEARVGRSDVVYLALKAGEGGLAARVADRLARFTE